MKRYFAETTAPDASDLADSLWSSPAALSESDRTVLLEQYKLYVELADRVSARRGIANTFFLTLNTAIFTLFGVFWDAPPDVKPWIGIFPALVLVTQCLVWFWVIRAYRQLNAGKWAVVGAIERRLPASPWWSAEWAALGEGKDPARYWPLTHIEQSVPLLFAIAYLGGFLALLLAA